MNRKLSNVTSTQVKRLAGIGGLVLAGSLATFLAVRARAAGIPAANALTYTGYLETPDGKPIATDINVTVNVWDAATDGKKVCEATAEKLKPVAGRFQVPLPDCQAPVGATPDLWLEALIDGTSLGRTKVGAVPYAVEANHASVADAAGEGSPLATQLTELQAGIDALKARADGPLAVSLAASQAGKMTLDKADWVWVSGIAPSKLPAGRYWVTNTTRVWAFSTGCTTGCTSAVVFAVSCMRVGNTITAGAGEVVAEPPSSAVSLPLATVGAVDFAKETANVELGLCAKRNTLGTGLDAIIANSYTTVLAQPK